MIYGLRLLLIFVHLVFADKFPPAHLLNAHLKYSKMRKYQKAKKSNVKLKQIIDQETAIMRRVLRCITNHKLESLYPPEDLENYIVHLEKQKERGNDTAQREKKKEERKKKLSVPSTKSKSWQENGIKWPCMNMSAEATPSLSASAGCNLPLKPSPLEQSVSLIADQAAACSLWDSAAFSVDTNSFNWQHGCLIAHKRSLEQFTSTGAVDKAAPVRKSCILLLEQLRTFLLQIEPHVNEEVLKLAVDWKEITQKHQKGVMAYGFLQLIVTYCLLSAYDADELLCLLVIASEYRQSPDLCLALGLTDKIHVLIETIVKDNLRLEAIAYICAFDLVDKFPPAHMLKVHLEYSKESLYHKAKKSHWKWHQIIDHEIAVVRKVIGCIADHKLESLYPPNDLEDYIIQLEMQKAERNDAAREQKQKTGRKKTPQVPSANSKPQHECGTKLPSINVSAEAVSSTSASAGSTVKPSPLQLLESFFADQAVPHLLGDSTNFSANTNLLTGERQADMAINIIANNESSDSD
ncbi:hypothetical protein CRYUN_Cryun08bG0039900 [Craigia yunnanensis]